MFGPSLSHLARQDPASSLGIGRDILIGTESGGKYLDSKAAPAHTDPWPWRPTSVLELVNLIGCCRKVLGNNWFDCLS